MMTRGDAAVAWLLTAFIAGMTVLSVSMIVGGDGESAVDSGAPFAEALPSGGQLVQVLVALRRIETEQRGLRAEVAQLSARIGALQADNEALRNLVAGCRPREGNADGSATLTTPTAVSSSPQASTTPRISHADLHYTLLPAAFSSSGLSLISCVLVTRDGRLIVGDLMGQLKMSSTADQIGFVSSVDVSYQPWAIVELPDGRIAVTSREDTYRISLYRIHGEELEPAGTMSTEAAYGAMAAGGADGDDDDNDDTLIVGTYTPDPVARIDLIDLQGRVLRSLLRDAGVMRDPYCLRRWGDHVYFTDISLDRLSRVDLHTGLVEVILGGGGGGGEGGEGEGEGEEGDGDGDRDGEGEGGGEGENTSGETRSFLSYIRSFDFDVVGNIYLAAGGTVCDPASFCVLRISQGGRVEVVTSYTSQHGGIKPSGVEVTADAVIISWINWDNMTSELTAYYWEGLYYRW